MTTIDSFPTEPTLTIKAVQNRTGIKPVTLRAWERRYDLLQPTRMANGYRLYSERDVQLLLWVQRKLDSDMTISQVVQQFKRDREKGEYSRRRRSDRGAADRPVRGLHAAWRNPQQQRCRHARARCCCSRGRSRELGLFRAE